MNYMIYLLTAGYDLYDLYCDLDDLDHDVDDLDYNLDDLTMIYMIYTTI